MKHRSWSIAVQRPLPPVDLRSIRFQMIFVASHKPMSNIYAVYKEKEKASRTLADVMSVCFVSYGIRVISSLVALIARGDGKKVVAAARGILVILPYPAED